MRIPRAAAFTLVVSAAVFFSAGCPGGESPANPLAIELGSDVKPLEPGARQAIPVRITNRGSAPVLLASISLMVQTPELNQNQTEDFAGAARAKAREDGTFELRMTISTDDPGAAARAPRDPKFDFEGDAEVVAAPAILPGGTYENHFEVAAPLDADAAKVEVKVAYRLAEGAPLLALVDARAESIPAAGPPSASGRGWVPVARLIAVYKPAPKPEAPKTPPTWKDIETLGPLGVDLSQGPPPFALRKADFQKLDSKTANETLSVPVTRPAFTLAAAKKKAGLAETVMAGYLPGEKTWILLGPKSVFLVSEKRMAEAAGSILPADLAKSEHVELALPSLELAAPLLEAGFTVNSQAKKGGGMAISVDVPREKLFEFFQAVSDAGLGFNGKELRKP